MDSYSCAMLHRRCEGSATELSHAGPLMGMIHHVEHVSTAPGHIRRRGNALLVIVCSSKSLHLKLPRCIILNYAQTDKGWRYERNHHNYKTQHNVYQTKEKVAN